MQHPADPYYSSGQWRALRAQQLAREPTCRACGAPAAVADHITPRRLGGSDASDNLQSLCDRCHQAKRQRERLAYYRR